MTVARIDRLARSTFDLFAEDATLKELVKSYDVGVGDDFAAWGSGMRPPWRGLKQLHLLGH